MGGFEIPAVIGVLLLGIFALFKTVTSGAKKQGQTEATLEAQKEINKATVAQAEATTQSVEEANEIHDRLERDPAYAQRVRDRFSRD